MCKSKRRADSPMPALGQTSIRDQSQNTYKKQLKTENMWWVEDIVSGVADMALSTKSLPNLKLKVTKESSGAINTTGLLCIMYHSYISRHCHTE